MAKRVPAWCSNASYGAFKGRTELESGLAAQVGADGEGVQVKGRLLAGLLVGLLSLDDGERDEAERCVDQRDDLRARRTSQYEDGEKKQQESANTGGSRRCARERGAVRTCISSSSSSNAGRANTRAHKV